MYDIYLNCQEKKKKKEEEEESAYRTAMREIHTHTHLTKKSSAVVHEKKRIDSILWQKKREEEREKKIRTSIYKVNTNENHCSSSN